VVGTFAGSLQHAAHEEECQTICLIGLSGTVSFKSIHPMAARAMLAGSSSTDDSRLRGTLPKTDSCAAAKTRN
jgi:hypothetical protein